MSVPIPCPHCGFPQTEVERMRVEYRPGDSGAMTHAATVYGVRCLQCQHQFDHELPPGAMQPESGR